MGRNDVSSRKLTSDALQKVWIRVDLTASQQTRQTRQEWNQSASAGRQRVLTCRRFGLRRGGM